MSERINNFKYSFITKIIMIPCMVMMILIFVWSIYDTYQDDDLFYSFLGLLAVIVSIICLVAILKSRIYITDNYIEKKGA